MSEKLRESLSATMDGETDAFELRRVLDEARSNPDLRNYWYRQHLLSSVIRGEDISQQDRLRERLLADMEELSDEVGDDPLVAEKQEVVRQEPNRWLGRITGTTVAVAVAVLVVVNGDLLVGPDEPAGFSEIAQLNSSPQPIQTAPVMYDVATAADRNRTDALMVHHIQQNALNNPGAASLIRFIAFDRKQPKGAERPLPVDASTTQGVPVEQ